MLIDKKYVRVGSLAVQLLYAMDRWQCVKKDLILFKDEVFCVGVSENLNLMTLSLNGCFLWGEAYAGGGGCALF